MADSIRTRGLRVPCRTLLHMRTLLFAVMLLSSSAAQAQFNQGPFQFTAPYAQPLSMLPAEVRASYQEAAESEFGSESEEGEEEDEIETDRDSFTPATTLVGAGRSMLESSYSIIDNRASLDRHSFPELLLRVGLTDWFELRLGANVEIGGGGTVSGSELGGDEEGTGSKTETNVLYGFKAALTDQIGWVPRSALIVQANTPTSGPDTATQLVTGYVAGWTLPNGWIWDYSVRYVAANEEHDHFNQWAPSTVLKIPFYEKWNTHIEYFGIFSDNKADNVNPQYFSPGVHYLISPNCEVGVRTGWGINRDAANFFANVGIGWRR